jgi:cobalt-precorrin-5B (C1)-methyltransferase
MAIREGFPEDHLVYYEHEDTASLIARLKPQAILTKESGKSGGFPEKIEAARKSGTPVFVVERPTFSYDNVVNGPHGLRLKIQELLPDFFELHTGLTTGTCATASAVAVLEEREERREERDYSKKFVSVRIPDGEDIEVKIEKIEGDTATVVKSAGDDPDLTDGLEICAKVRLFDLHDSQRIIIKGGEGVGTVTLPGLGLPIGAPAINETPQRMIRENLLPLLPEGKGAEVVISVPQGREVGAKTFNPRIGVQGGISIIGTSGIVKPFSSEAWVSSIRKEMAVGLEVVRGERLRPEIVINSGAKSEAFLHQRFPQLPLQAFVHYGNFIGETIRIAAELGVSHLVMGVMIGKAVKLAEGNLDTHSRQVTMNRSFIQQMAIEAGLDASRIETLNMARELWTLYDEKEMESFGKVILRHCHEHCDALLPNGQLDILLISDQGKII